MMTRTVIKKLTLAGARQCRIGYYRSPRGVGGYYIFAELERSSETCYLHRDGCWRKTAARTTGEFTGYWESADQAIVAVLNNPNPLVIEKE